MLPNEVDTNYVKFAFKSPFGTRSDLY
jgi:hypothetical protein